MFEELLFYDDTCDRTTTLIIFLKKYIINSKTQIRLVFVFRLLRSIHENMETHIVQMISSIQPKSLIRFLFFGSLNHVFRMRVQLFTC